MTLRVELEQAVPLTLNVQLTCAPGELLALIGPSGSGKTSVLRAIAGLSMPQRGRIACNGETWFDAAQGIALPPQARRVGLVFQDYALMPHLTALDNVALPLRNLTKAGARARAAELLALVNLEGLEARRPQHLSGGQRQRVAIARALAREPAVLLLDEPFSAVDQMTRERLKRELVALRARVTIPIILVTHDLDEAMALADRIAIMHRGRTLQSGRPEAVRLRPDSATIARLMGQTNVLEGRVETPAADGTPGRLAFNGQILQVAVTGPFKAGDPVAWLIPSEFIVLHRRGRPSQGDRENPLAGVVQALTALGEQTAVSVRLAGGCGNTLNFRIPTHAARRNELSVGADVTLSALAEGIHLMRPENKTENKTEGKTESKTDGHA